MKINLRHIIDLHSLEDQFKAYNFIMEALEADNCLQLGNWIPVEAWSEKADLSFDRQLGPLHEF